MSVARSRLAAWCLGAAILAAACSTSTQPAGPSGTTDLAGQFNQVWTTFDQIYSYFDVKRINWNALRTEFEPRAASAGSQDRLMLVLQEMLGRLHDQHVVISGPGTTLRTYVPGFFVNWDEGVWRQYLARANATMRGAAVSAVMNGVAYIAVSSWNPAQLSVADLDAFVDAFRDRPALIVDVRMNPGGDDSLAFQFAGRFTAATTIADYYQTRNGPNHGDFTPRTPRTVSPRGSFQFTRPVLLLTGRRSASSNEGFIAAMQELPNVTSAGDTSAGSSGNPQTFTLPGGWSYTVSRWIHYTAAGQIIEDQGIQPRVNVPASAADFAGGRDPVLDFALAQLPASVSASSFSWPARNRDRSRLLHLAPHPATHLVGFRDDRILVHRQDLTAAHDELAVDHHGFDVVRLPVVDQR